LHSANKYEYAQALRVESFVGTCSFTLRASMEVFSVRTFVGTRHRMNQPYTNVYRCT